MCVRSAGQGEIMGLRGDPASLFSYFSIVRNAHETNHIDKP